MNHRKPFLCLVFCALCFLPACHKKHRPEPASENQLFSNTQPQVQPPAGDAMTQGLWWLYQLQYEKARAIFSELAQQNPEDPKGAFYETATDWWQLAGNLDQKLPGLQERFYRDADETVRRSQALLKSTSDAHQKALAHLYWGGAEGLRGRWLITQDAWMKAYSAGKEGHGHLEDALKEDPSLEDAYLGLGIYDYYTDVLPGVMGALSKFMMHGDRKRGLSELHRALENGVHSRVEASIFLIEIYGHEEKTPEKALPLARELRQEFPSSPAMLMSEMGVYSEMHRWKDLAADAQFLLDHSQKQMPYFDASGMSPGHYFLGLAALQGSGDASSCIEQMNWVIEHEKNPASRWVTFAYLRRGQAYDLLRERSKADTNYKKVLSRADVWNSQSEAHRYLDSPFRLK